MYTSIGNSTSSSAIAKRPRCRVG